MNAKLVYFFFWVPIMVCASPLSVTNGGTGLATMTAAGGLLYSTSATTLAVLPIGTANYVLTVTNGLPAWNNFFPGYTAATGFAFAGASGTLAHSANHTMIISTTAPASIATTATDNTVVGYYAFNGVTSNTNCVAVGSGALSVATGIQNTAVGYQALNSVTSGTDNTALGYQAGFHVSTGNAGVNTAIGYQALFTNTSGTSSTACGVHALYNSTGNQNTGFGYYAGQAITSGVDNVAFGANALFANQTGSDNVAVGYNSLNNSTASNNTGVGYSALFTNTSGTPNVAVGSQAMYTNLSGANNVAVGYQALNANSTASQCTALGHVALANSTGGDNTAIGYNALHATTGTRNTAIGSGAGATATIGSNNIYIGYNATPISVGESNNIVIGNTGSPATATAYIFGIYNQASGGGVNLLINSSGKLGTSSSSKKFKENIVNVTKEVQKLLDLNVVRFHYINDENKEIQYGLIAEEVDEIMPEIVIRDKNNEVQTVQYHKLIPLLVKEVQITNNEIQDLKDELIALQDSIQSLLVTYMILKNQKSEN